MDESCCHGACISIEGFQVLKTNPRVGMIICSMSKRRKNAMEIEIQMTIAWQVNKHDDRQFLCTWLD